jgi:hypothetical protein
MRKHMPDVLIAGKKLAKESEHTLDSVPHKAFEHEKEDTKWKQAHINDVASLH